MFAVLFPFLLVQCFAVLFSFVLAACTQCTRALRALRARVTEKRVPQLVADALPTQPLPNGYFVKMQAMRAGRPKGPLRCAEREGSEQHTSQQDTSQGLGWPHKKPGGEATFERPDVRRLKDGKAVVPAAARAPRTTLHLARVMKAPTRPLSKKRAAEELLGRVHLPRLYALWQAAGAARRPAHLALWTTGLRRDSRITYM